MAEKESPLKITDITPVLEDSNSGAAENLLEISPAISLVSTNGHTTVPTTSTTTTIPSSSSTLLDRCAKCGTTSQTNKLLKKCNKCQSVAYCTRECQKTDFKSHKRACAAAAQLYASTANFHMETTRASRDKNVKDGFKKGLQKWQFDT
ncbi:putative mynd domain [Erysiphe neolycopersici]|uniref:Putative mynd domain n=1 Tax=Erysiphe neolycopersici TaxID=212602 RepID=A0A420H948_9PEZI|nr:putative mynd domain [Erysiphe neolycopersici]